MKFKFGTLLLFLAGSAYSQSANSEQYRNAQLQYNQQYRNEQRETALNQMRRSAENSVEAKKDLQYEIELNFKEKKKLNMKLAALMRQKTDLQSMLKDVNDTTEKERIAKQLNKKDIELEKVQLKIESTEAEFKVLFGKFQDYGK